MEIKFNDNNLLDIVEKYNNERLEDNDKRKILMERNIKEYEINDKTEKLSLISFIFQFNQILMMINNPMFFPHISYVKMFNEYLEEANQI